MPKSLPTGWTADESPLPGWLSELYRIVSEKPVQVEKGDYTPELIDSVTESFADLVHGIFNNCVRSCGIEIEGRASEISWEKCFDFSRELNAWIVAGVREAREREDYEERQKKDREIKRARLEELEREVRLLKEELGDRGVT